MGVLAAVVKTVITGGLDPVTGSGVAVVDVVAASKLLVAGRVWLLELEAGVSPVLVERHRLFDSHGVDELPFLSVLG